MVGVGISRNRTACFACTDYLSLKEFEDL
jgi:hypothetical protein